MCNSGLVAFVECRFVLHDAMLAEDETTYRKGLHIGSVLFRITVFALITAKGESDLLKKLIRLAVAMIVGSLILMNLSLADSSGSVSATAVMPGSRFCNSTGCVCFCPGEECVPCVDWQGSQGENYVVCFKVADSSRGRRTLNCSTIKGEPSVDLTTPDAQSVSGLLNSGRLCSG